jgi:hypothetical protein
LAITAALSAPCASTSARTLVSGSIVPVRSQPACGSVTPVRQRRRNTSLVFPEIS